MAVYLDHISKTYGKKQVLNRFCARLEDGGIYCLMGQSGIGKTTLLRILMGLEPPSGGTVSFWSARPGWRTGETYAVYQCGFSGRPTDRFRRCA